MQRVGRPVARSLALATLLAASALPDTAWAAGNDVLLGERAAHPLSALIGVPNAAVRAPGATPWQLVLTHGNAYMGGIEDGQTLLLDGETTRLSLRYRRALGDCWSGEVDGSVLSHGGGSFDAGIETWHDWFGLPNAGRDDAPRDELHYVWQVDGQAGAPSLEQASSGLGDTQLSVQRPIDCSPGTDADRRTLLRAGIKLPTGSLDDWSGSGAADVWADVQSPIFEPAKGLRLAASVGLILPGDADDLANQRDVAVFGAFGARLVASSRVALHAVIDWHTSLFDSELPELGQPAASLATGFSFAPGPRSRVEVQILEDVLVDTATDITLRIGVTLGIDRHVERRVQ